MNQCELINLLEKESETYRQFERLYKRCKHSLDEFYLTFQDNNGPTLSLAQLQKMTQEIQGLSQRVIELENKIETVSKRLRTCDKTQRKEKCVAYIDRKLLPSEKKLLQPGEGSCTELKRITVDNLSAKRVPDCSRSRSCRLLGGEPVQRPKVKRNRRAREAMRSREASAAVIGKKQKPKQVDSDKRKMTRGTAAADKKDSTTAVIETPERDNESVLYMQVNKFIPKVLSELEVFHQTFIQACDSKERQIDEKTARDVLQVMGDQLKVLENMECRLRDAKDKSHK